MRPIALIGLLSLITAGASGQASRASRSRAGSLNCRACHTAVVPTRQNPALAACPRLQIKGFHFVDEAPVSLTLGSSDGRYGPVKFAHRAHAHMAETAKGCSGCHHYDQAGPIQPCTTCHAATRLRTDLGKPDRTAALHRQCLDCHLSWNPTTACGTCHAPAPSASARRASARRAKVITPERIVYETGAKEGKTVTFFHVDHTSRFALACSACHVEESCRTCHAAKPAENAALVTRRTPPGRTQLQAHARCATCHARDACAKCHSSAPPRTARFDHARVTGWALNRFHAPLACKQCHTMPAPPLIAPLRTTVSVDCEGCHKGWQKTFDHGKTGLALDEVHAGVDCVSCHADTSFRARPTCAGGCHTDKSYPAQKPGKVVPRAAAGR